jgi:DNA polymerase-3 subunit gamma/tau
MLEVVDELERAGQNLQHFARELARYLRNLLVARIAGAETRLIAASPAQRQRMAQIAAQFSEEDLTRYLTLTLEIFSDLQFSLQPRFHLEIGLVRLVQAGKLLPIEEALASLGGESPQLAAPARAVSQATTQDPRGAPSATPAPSAPPPPPRPSPFDLDRAKKAGSRLSEPQSSGANALSPQLAPQPQAAPSLEPVGGDWRERLHSALMELGMPFTADAIENASVVENGGELQIFTTKAYSLALRPDDLNKALQHLGARSLRIRVIVGAAGAAPSGAPVAPLTLAPPAQEDEATARALANPEVQRFREVFGGEIRKVRNLKE